MLTNQLDDDSRSFRRGCGGIFFCIMLVVAAVCGAGLGVFFHFLNDAKDTIAALEEFRPPIGSRVYSHDMVLLGEFSMEERQIVRLSEVPLHLQKAFLATEDGTFYEHRGVRPDALLRVAVRYLEKGDAQGASTITQQVVRNVKDLEVGTERTLQRKIREAIVSFQVEREFTKDEILELYLNQVFFGISAGGVEAASRQYFNKTCRDVTLGEGAMLAGLLRSPNSNQPFKSFDNALKRRNIVLGQMLQNRFITQEEYEAGLAEDLAESVVTPEERIILTEANETVMNPNEFKAPYFVEEVKQFVLDEFGKDEVFGTGMEIYTTLDMRMQAAAEKALLGALDRFDKRREGREGFVPVTGALVCIDNRPQYKGFVRALVGGRDFDKQKFNNATQALRQPGSSVKPFVWATAVAQAGYTASTHVLDAPYSKRAGGGKMWTPKNFDGKYHGSVPIRYALEKSINTVSVRITEKVGMPAVRSLLERSGIRTPIEDSVSLTIGLGTYRTTVLDQTVAYSVFPNGGIRYDPVLVTEILDRDGVSDWTYKQFARSEAAMPEDVAYVVSHMMEAVAKYGTGATGTKGFERPKAGKTGTSNDARDVWFCGYTPEFTCCIWVGYSDNRPLGDGNDYTGGRLAAPIWTEFMQVAHEGLPVQDFEVPFGIEFHNINRNSGYAGGDYKEAYRAGTGPLVYKPKPKPVDTGAYNPLVPAGSAVAPPTLPAAAPAGEPALTEAL